MIEGTAKLIIDMGNSETRILTIFGKNRSGLPNQEFRSFSNLYAEHRRDLMINDTINEDNSVIFNAMGGLYAGGLLVEREYSNRMLRPTALEKKYDLSMNDLVLSRAFLEGYRAVAAMRNVSIHDLDLSWEVTVLMPPADITSIGSKKMADKIRSIKEINFEMPDFQADIVIPEGGINVVAEGASAYISMVFDRSGNVREDYEHLLDSSVLVVDIGAGTTDFIVVKDGSVIESTKYTVNTGGNNVTTQLRQRLQRVRDIKVDLASAGKAVITGEIVQGASKVSVIDDVAYVKKEVSYNLIEELNSSFESSGYQASNINYLLVVGGGSLSSETEGIEPIAKYLVEKLVGYSPGVGLVEIPNGGEGRWNPRLLNIMGAGIQATMGG